MSDKKRKDEYNPIPDNLATGDDEFIRNKFKGSQLTSTREPDFYEIEIPLKDLEQNPNNQRENLDVNKESSLYRSLDMYDLLNPLLVIRHPEKTNKYIIIGGNRRYAALVLKYGGESSRTVLCRVSLKNYGLEDNVKDLVFQIQDNMIRSNLSHRDQFNLITKLKTLMENNTNNKVSARTLSAFTLLSEDHIKKIMSFDSMSEEDKDYSDSMSASASIEFTRASKEDKEIVKTSGAKTVEDIRNIKRFKEKNISKTKNVAIPRGHKFRLKHDLLSCDIATYRSDISLTDAFDIIAKEMKKERQHLWKMIK